MNRSVVALVAGAGIVLGGCSSLSSTYVGHAAQGEKFQGMPIVVKRPKYLKVTYKVVTYATFADKSGSNTAEVEMVANSERTVQEIETEVVEVGEVYAVDVKRPAAGTADYALEFEPGSQYPKKVGAKIEDKTIESIGATVGELIKKAGETFMLAASQESAKAEVRRIAEEVTRIELRSLDDPSIMIQVFP